MQLELDNIFSKQLFGKIELPTSSAFFQRRKKLKSSFFKSLLDHLNETYYSYPDIKLFKGMRLLAIDGSNIKLPETKELREKYGGPKSYKNNKGLVCGHLSTIYDIKNEIVLDIELSKYKGSEREMAESHLNYCNSGDLIIFDRGYPSLKLIKALEKKGIKYLMRSKLKFNKETENFSKSNSEDKTIEIKDVKIRMLKIKLDNGEEELLLTNLSDNKEYPKEIFKELYNARWGIETNYDVLKNILEIENFSSYDENSILQDIYSTMILRNYQSYLIEEIEEEIEKKYGKRKYEYKVNKSISIGHINGDLLNLLSDKDINKTYEKLKKIFIRNVIPIRKGRKEIREKDKYRNRKKPKVLKNRKRVL